MDEQSIDVWAAATSLAEILAQHARYGGDALLHSWIHVSPSGAAALEDADFAMRFEQEDDAGDDYYVVEACRIHGGALSVTRRLTRTPERR